MPDVHDRQTDIRQHYRLMPRLLGAGHKKGMTKGKVCGLPLKQLQSTWSRRVWM